MTLAKNILSLLCALGMVYFFNQIPNQKFLVNSYLQISAQNNYLNAAEICLNTKKEELAWTSAPKFELAGLGYSDETFSAGDMCLRRYGSKIQSLKAYNDFKSVRENFLFKDFVNQPLNKESNIFHIQHKLSELYPSKIQFKKDLCPMFYRAISNRTRVHTLLLICYNFFENTDECFSYQNKDDLYLKVKNFKGCNENI